MRPLSARMPATVEATLPARDPATRPSDTQDTGDGGSPNAPVGSCSQVTDHGANDIEWEALNDNKPGWEIGMDEQKGPGWETADRKDENDEGNIAQRPAEEQGPEE